MSGAFVLSDGLTPARRLENLRASGNFKFTESLHPGVDNVLGVRVPDVRALAAEIARGDWRAYLASPGRHYMEERMLHGLVLGQIKVADTEEYLDMIDRFVRDINSWSVCDTFDFAGKKRFVGANAEAVRRRLVAYLGAGEEYTVRFGTVMLMKYFASAPDADRFMDLMESVSHPAYYARVAVAWAVAEIFAKAPAAILRRLEAGRLDVWTHNKAVQKITESRRVSDADKEAARRLRRR